MSINRLFTLLIATVVLSGMAQGPSAAANPGAFRVYLAFEDGPTDAYTPGILDILAQYGAKASFLIAGMNIAGHEAILQREIREGHAIVNHLWEEPGVYAGAPDRAVIDSYRRTEAAIRDALGPELARYDAQTKMFWQPGGGAQPFPASTEIAVITYNWNVNSDDCGWGMPAEVDLDTVEFDQAVIANVLGESVSVGSFHNPYNAYDYGDGVVIAFHDLNRVTGRVLPTILSELQAAGATFEPLPRPWDEIGTMPIALGVPPQEGTGISGVTLDGLVITDARLRSQPSRSGDILATVPPDTLLTVIGRAPGWVQVQYGDGLAWISRDLVRIFGPIPNLPLMG
jgi:peptidoglycan/xylan/chitin deacetylase (PgdA/CDA1 family)